MLPAKLGMSVIMPVGEACIISVAYKIAVMKAITDIREHKTEKLLGTKWCLVEVGAYSSSIPGNGARKQLDGAGGYI
jgi:hypothetical protein